MRSIMDIGTMLRLAARDIIDEISALPRCECKQAVVVVRVYEDTDFDVYVCTICDKVVDPKRIEDDPIALADGMAIERPEELN